MSDNNFRVNTPSGYDSNAKYINGITIPEPPDRIYQYALMFDGPSNAYIWIRILS